MILVYQLALSLLETISELNNQSQICDIWLERRTVGTKGVGWSSSQILAGYLILGADLPANYYSTLPDFQVFLRLWNDAIHNRFLINRQLKNEDNLVRK